MIQFFMNGPLSKIVLKQGDYIEIKVSHTGIGIAPETSDRFSILISRLKSPAREPT